MVSWSSGSGSVSGSGAGWLWLWLWFWGWLAGWLWGWLALALALGLAGWLALGLAGSGSVSCLLPAHTRTWELERWELELWKATVPGGVPTGVPKVPGPSPVAPTGGRGDLDLLQLLLGYPRARGTNTNCGKHLKERSPHTCHEPTKHTTNNMTKNTFCVAF